VTGADQEAGDQGERGPVQAPVAGQGVRPQLDIGPVRGRMLAIMLGLAAWTAWTAVAG